LSKEFGMARFRRYAVAFLAAVVACAEEPALADSLLAHPVTLSNGIVGHIIAFQGSNPKNFEQVISHASLQHSELTGQLFLPKNDGRRMPTVIIVPGSGGVSKHMLVHASLLTSADIAVLLIDPFTGRGVKETIADQNQFSFAATAYDVLAAARRLESLPSVDPTRIGAMGYSRGGFAVLMAASKPFATAVLGSQKPQLKAVLAGWPWCGMQFRNATTTNTAVRLSIADLDDWTSPLQCDAWASAMRGSNPNVSLRLFENAYHGFGYEAPLAEFPQAITALNAPIVYVADDGAYLDWYTNEPIRNVDDSYWTRRGHPWVQHGVRVGTRGSQSKDFTDDMLRFFQANLQGTS
jgi:dienelactone hydrolase